MLKSGLIDLINQIRGWRSVGGVGVSYRRGYSVEQVRKWSDKIEDDLKILQ